MSTITIKEKSEDISYEKIHSILEEAHKVNNQRGFHLRTASLDGSKIEKRIGEKGKCFVALDKEKVVGTISIRMVKRNCWYAKGEIPDYMLAGVLPEYQGKHINSMLAKKVFEYSKTKGYRIIELDTAENNQHAINVYKHQGFKLVDFKAFEGTDHYSVVMAKWLYKCPYPNIYIYLRYLIKKIYIKSRYKIGREKRFGI